ncbi:MAG: glycosyltransferase family 2 protein, partial [Bacteroidia bacterium]
MSLSIVIPVYRLKGREEALHDYMKAIEAEMSQPIEWVLVQDGLDAAIDEFEQRYAVNFAELRILKLIHRSGQYTATALGLSQARGTWMLSLDDDARFPVSMVGRFVRMAVASGAELTYAHFAADSRGQAYRWSVRLLKWALAIGYPLSWELSSMRMLKKGIWTFSNRRVSYLDGDLMDAAAKPKVVEFQESLSESKRSGYR